MPLQNRVTPSGDIIASPARGTMMGNRGGCFHTSDKNLRTRRYASKQWICCLLAFKSRHRQVMMPGRYTELFFLDEATALAAGHRPCFECRRSDAEHFATIWSNRLGSSERTAAPDIDMALHPQRISGTNSKIVWRARPSDLPNGTFVRLGHIYYLKWRDKFLPWTPAGYASATFVDPNIEVDVLTPHAMVEQLRAGYVPMIHATATES